MNGRGDIGISQPADAWIKQTLLYRRWIAIRNEIMLHKWYESERAGHDIGWERAAVDWMIKYGSSRVENNTSNTCER